MNNDTDESQQTCVSTLTMRHLAIGGGTLRELNQLRAPMAAVFEAFRAQKEELERYRQKYGELDDNDRSNGVILPSNVEEIEDGSETEQE
jgi:adenylate cyclase